MPAIRRSPVPPNPTRAGTTPLPHIMAGNVSKGRWIALVGRPGSAQGRIGTAFWSRRLDIAFVRKIGAVDGTGNRLAGLIPDTSCPCWRQGAHIGRLLPWRRSHPCTRSERAATPAKTDATTRDQGAPGSSHRVLTQLLPDRPIAPHPLPKALSKHRQPPVERQLRQ